jgi:hypothetical protein
MRELNPCFYQVSEIIWTYIKRAAYFLPGAECSMLGAGLDHISQHHIWSQYEWGVFQSARISLSEV